MPSSDDAEFTQVGPDREPADNASDAGTPAPGMILKDGASDETPVGQLVASNPSDPEKPTDDGPVAGWTVEGLSKDKYAVPRALDVVPLETWTHKDLPCVLFSVTRYFIRGYGTRPQEEHEYEEKETTYIGMVYCPAVETPNAAYSGVRPHQSDCEDWFQTAAADDVKKPGLFCDTLVEAVRAKTCRIASGLRSHGEEYVCECGWTRTNEKWPHDDGCPAAGDEWLPADA